MLLLEENLDRPYRSENAPFAAQVLTSRVGAKGVAKGCYF
jgi:hypothetical protein